MPQKYTYYSLFGIAEDASLEEIKAAYRRLAFQYHPDRNGDTEESRRTILVIQKIYSVLSDPEKRRQYDSRLAAERAQANRPVYTATVNAEPSDEEEESPSAARMNQRVKILFFVVVAALILGAIFHEPDQKTSYSPSSTRFSDTANTETEPAEAAQVRYNVALPTGATPYSSAYGEGIYDQNSLSELTITNGNATDAVVILYNVSTQRVDRHVYVQAHSTYTMKQLPAGWYDLKIRFGQDWNPDYDNGVGHPRGGFNWQESFSHLNPSDYLDTDPEYQSDGVAYPTYSITLHRVEQGNLQTASLDQNDFFAK